MAGIGDAPFIQKLAVPAVCILISFLGYSSQILFHMASSLQPGPPTRSETIIFNTLLVCLWYTYYKACTVDPGRFNFSPVIDVPSSDDDLTSEPDSLDEMEDPSRKRTDPKSGTKRWCRKCDLPKPPRAHHCRHCDRCIPKMDHHCPWTANCVSHTTLPHFFRFLLYANLALWYLFLLLSRRFGALWVDRHLPAYLGPSMPALVHLSFLAPVWFFTTVALGIMLFATAKDLLFNTTTIEGWEIDKHAEVVARASRGAAAPFWSEDGAGDDDDEEDRGRDRKPRAVEKVEFPYDIGFFANVAEAMGSANPLAWVLPWSGNPVVAPQEGSGSSGWTFPENGFNDCEGMWPPPDPDKRVPKHLVRGGKRRWPGADDEGDVALPTYASKEDEIAAFRARQEADLRRRQAERDRLMAELEEVADPGAVSGDPAFDDAVLVDHSDEEIPLAELIRRRKVLQKDGQAD